MDSQLNMQINLLGIFTIKEHVRGGVLLYQPLKCNRNIEIPNYELINLTKSNCKLWDGQISLCSKGLSFISIPNTFNTFNWTQLQVDFYKFRKKNFLQEMKHVVTLTAVQHWQLTLTIDNPPPMQSLCTPPKSNSNEIETFIFLVEKDLF